MEFMEFSGTAFLFCRSDLTLWVACRGHPERGEAVADDGGARRAAGAARAAQVLRQGEPQADQSVSGNHTSSQKWDKGLLRMYVHVVV